MASRVEKLLKGTYVKPQSRAEEFLAAALTEEKETDLPTPRSRVESLLQQLADSGVGGGGGSVEEYDGEVVIE